MLQFGCVSVEKEKKSILRESKLLKMNQMLMWELWSVQYRLPFAPQSSQTIVEQGGLQPGGLNFDAKVRRESTDPEDLFIAHIGAMDAFARGLRNAVRIIEEGLLAGMVKVRIKSVTLFQPCCCNTSTPPGVARNNVFLASQRPWCC